MLIDAVAIDRSGAGSSRTPPLRHPRSVRCAIGPSRAMPTIAKSPCRRLSSLKVEKLSLCRAGKADAGDHLVVAAIGRIQALKEIAGRHIARPALRLADGSSRSAGQRPPAFPPTDRQAPDCRRWCRDCAPPYARHGSSRTPATAHARAIRSIPAPRDAAPARRCESRPALPRYRAELAIRLMSTSMPGDDSRILSVGIRLWPPASTCASPALSASSASASSRRIGTAIEKVRGLHRVGSL